MRLYPAGGVASFRRIHTGKDLVLGDGKLVVPAGVALHFPITAVHHSRAVWVDPEAFSPERFLEVRPGGLRQRRSPLCWERCPLAESQPSLLLPQSPSMLGEGLLTESLQYPGVITVGAVNCSGPDHQRHHVSWALRAVWPPSHSADGGPGCCRRARRTQRARRWWAGASRSASSPSARATATAWARPWRASTWPPPLRSSSATSASGWPLRWAALSTCAHTALREGGFWPALLMLHPQK